MSTLTKKHGGHQTGFRSDISAGRGPVFEIRKALGLSQAELGLKIGYSPKNPQRPISECERTGRWPKSPAVQSNLRGLAEEAGIDLSRWPLEDESGVFL